MARQVREVWSSSDIDRLGDRLRKNIVSDRDLRLLDSYRRSFAEAYERVVALIRDELGLEPTGRPAKSTTSIVEKLRRETIRLSQMQDVAGCRLLVENVAEQDQIAARLQHAFTEAALVDRREHPSHGYRAVHLVIGIGARCVEVQLRTPWQHGHAQEEEGAA